MDYLNLIFGQNENKQLEIAIVTIRISKQRYQIGTESTMKKGIQLGCLRERFLAIKSATLEDTGSHFAGRFICLFCTTYKKSRVMGPCAQKLFLHCRPCNHRL